MLERQIPNHKRIDDNAESPDVDGGAEQAGGGHDEFRGGVLQGAGDGGAGFGGADVVPHAWAGAGGVWGWCTVGGGVGRGGRRAAARGAGGEFREAEVAEEEVAAFGFGAGGGEVEQAVLELDVAVHDAHIFVEIAYCGSELVGVAASEVLTQAVPVRAHEVEERAAGVEFGEAEGRDGGDVDGYEGEDVTVAETSPERDFALELDLELVVLLLALAGHNAAHNLHGALNPFVAFEGVGFADDAEAAEADLAAEDVVAYFLALAIEFGWWLFSRSEFGEEGCGGGDGGGGRASKAGSGAQAEFAVEGVGFCSRARRLPVRFWPGTGFFEGDGVVEGRVGRDGEYKAVDVSVCRGSDFRKRCRGRRIRVQRRPCFELKWILLAGQAVDGRVEERIS